MARPCLAWRTYAYPGAHPREARARVPGKGTRQASNSRHLGGVELDCESGPVGTICDLPAPGQAIQSLAGNALLPHTLLDVLPCLLRHSRGRISR